jgi:hypothetical protein
LTRTHTPTKGHYKVRIGFPGFIIHAASWDEPRIRRLDLHGMQSVNADWIDDPAYGDTIGHIDWSAVVAITWCCRTAWMGTGATFGMGMVCGRDVVVGVAGVVGGVQVVGVGPISRRMNVGMMASCSRWRMMSIRALTPMVSLPGSSMMSTVTVMRWVGG